MKKYRYICKQYLSILISLCLVIAGIPQQGMGSGFLSPPGEQELVKAISAAPAQSGQSTGFHKFDTDEHKQIVEIDENRIREILQECLKTITEIRRCHRAQDGNEQKIEGADVIIKLPLLLAGFQMSFESDKAQTNLIDIINKLLNYSRLVDQYINFPENICKELFLKEGTDVSQYRNNVRAVAKNLRLILLIFLYLTFSKKNKDIFSKTEKIYKDFDRAFKSEDAKESFNVLREIYILLDPFDQSFDFLNKIILEVLHKSEKQLGEFNDEEKKVIHSLSALFQSDAGVIVDASRNFITLLDTIAQWNGAEKYTRILAAAECFMDERTRFNHAFRAEDGRIWFWGVWFVLVSFALPGLGMSIPDGWELFALYVKIVIIALILTIVISGKYYLMAFVTEIYDADGTDTEIALSDIDYNEIIRIRKRHRKFIGILKKNQKKNGKNINDTVMQARRAEMKQDLSAELARAAKHTALSADAQRAFVELACSDSIADRLVFNWIMTHEKVEARFHFLGICAHTAGMLGIFPVLGWLLIRPVLYGAGKISDSAGTMWRRLPWVAAKKRRSLAEFASSGLPKNLLMSDLTEEAIVETERAFGRLDCEGIRPDGRTYIQLKLLEERLKHNELSDSFISDIEEAAIPAVRACEIIAEPYVAEPSTVYADIVKQEEFKYLKRFYNYFTGLAMHERENKKGVEVYMPPGAYPVSQMLIAQMGRVGIFSIGIRIPPREEDRLSPEQAKMSYLSEAAFLNYVKDKKIQWLYDRYFDKDKDLYFKKLEDHVFKGKLKDIAHAALSGNFEKVREGVRELCSSEEYDVRKKAMRIAREAYPVMHREIIAGLRKNSREAKERFTEYCGGKRRTAAVLKKAGLTAGQFKNIIAYRAEEVEAVGRYATVRHTMQFSDRETVIFDIKYPNIKKPDAEELFRLKKEMDVTNQAHKEDATLKAGIVWIKKKPALIYRIPEGKPLEDADIINASGTEIIEIARALGFALGRLHAKEIVHKDLVFTTPDGNKKLRKQHISLIRGDDGGLKVYFTGFKLVKGKRMIGIDSEFNDMKMALRSELFRHNKPGINECLRVFHDAYNRGGVSAADKGAAGEYITKKMFAEKKYSQVYSDLQQIVSEFGSIAPAEAENIYFWLLSIVHNKNIPIDERCRSLRYAYKIIKPHMNWSSKVDVFLEFLKKDNPEFIRAEARIIIGELYELESNEPEENEKDREEHKKKRELMIKIILEYTWGSSGNNIVGIIAAAVAGVLFTVLFSRQASGAAESLPAVSAIASSIPLISFALPMGSDLPPLNRLRILQKNTQGAAGGIRQNRKAKPENISGTREHRESL